MKKFLIPAIALVAVSVAAPAAMAQNYQGQNHQGQNHQGQNRGDRDDRHDQEYRRDRDDRHEQDHRGDRDERENRGAWQSISQRKYQLDHRIDAGVRNGSLSRTEAMRLRTELNALVRLEYSYRQGGLSARERAELDRRYDRLAMQVRAERHDNDGRRH